MIIFQNNQIINKISKTKIKVYLLPKTLLKLLLKCLINLKKVGNNSESKWTKVISLMVKKKIKKFKENSLIIDILYLLHLHNEIMYIFYVKKL